VPWSWGKKDPGEKASAEPKSDLSPPISALGGELPLQSAVRFRVDDIFTILGEGCVAGGEVEEGTLRLPATMRLVTPEPRTNAPTIVEVLHGFSRRKPIAILPPGTKAGLTLRGIQGEKSVNLPGHLVDRWPVKKGDQLVLP
jgi:hypothetical protein